MCFIKLNPRDEPHRDQGDHDGKGDQENLSVCSHKAGQRISHALATPTRSGASAGMNDTMAVSQPTPTLAPLRSTANRALVLRA